MRGAAAQEIARNASQASTGMIAHRRCDPHGTGRLPGDDRFCSVNISLDADGLNVSERITDHRSIDCRLSDAFAVGGGHAPGTENCPAGEREGRIGQSAADGDLRRQP